MRGRGMAFMLGRATSRNNVQKDQSTQDSSASQIEELADLHKKGALTDEEFASAKKKILSGK